MKQPVRFAVVGLGRIAPRHIAAIESCKEAALVAVWDVHEDNRMNYLSNHPAVKTYATYEQLLSQVDIDVVCLCTPSGTHADMAIQAAQAGKHCIVEKPLALTTHHAKEVITSFQSTQRSLLVSLQNRWNAPIVHLQKMKAELGKQRFIVAHCYWYRTDEYYGDWHGTRELDGGVLFNQGSHYIDMLLYLSGKPLQSVSAFGAHLGHAIETEDTISANMLFEDGTLGNIQANTISYPEDLEGSITIWYEKATVKIGGTALNEIVFWKGQGSEAITGLENEKITDVYGNHHASVINNMVDHLLNGIPLFVPGEEAIESLSCMEAIAESVKQHGSVISV